ncbi:MULTISPECIES: N-acetylmuramoyl-L-alanine amidase [unclassified Aureimonas]|uniref:peptidoglycan recognition protein family protein n=1 Tax=unclassified Aureimonas TaxID=2615206 RepID=UPI000A835F79|nr:MULTISPECIES: N-acetylmuramoyl-L-alanine amidase [unclassified Aureimonas]
MPKIPASWMPRARMSRIIVHWTAGGYAVSALDREHYHVIIGGDGQAVRGDQPISANADPIRGAYAAHTLNCNSGSIGISVACMAGAVEEPFLAGHAPMKAVQWGALVEAVADLCQAYAIVVTPRTVLSHAEVQGTLGIRQRGKWDISRLAFDPTTIGAKACGDRLRREVSAALTARRTSPAVPSTQPQRFAAFQEPVAMSRTSAAIQRVILDAVHDTVARSSVPAEAEAAAPIAQAVIEDVVPLVLNATNSEPWYQSRVILGSATTIVSSLAALIGLAQGGSTQADLYAAPIVALLGAAFALYGRLAALKPIGAS